MSLIRFGVIGCGVIGSTHAKYIAASSHASLAAVADVRMEQAEKNAAEFGADHYYDSADALIADKNVQAVILAMPTVLRFEIALKALAAGKHVLIEKPIAMNQQQVRDMIQAQGDRVVGCCSARSRFIESARFAADFLKDDPLGDIRMIRVRGVSQAGPPRPPEKPAPAWRISHPLNGGGIFVNWGSYDLDYVLGLLQWRMKPKSVSAQCWPVAKHLAHGRVHPDSDAETHMTALIKCHNGAVINIERGELVADQTENTMQLIGDRGSLRLKSIPVEHGQVLHIDTTADKGAQQHVLWEGQDTWIDMGARLIDDFASAVRDGHAPSTSLENALVLQQITDAVYESSRTGREVTLD